MAISVNYPSPVTVNGYSCKNCTDVDYAAKQIDPAHPESGPNNVNAAHDVSRSPADRARFASDRDAAQAAIAEVAGYSPGGLVMGRSMPGAVISMAA